MIKARILQIKEHEGVSCYKFEVVGKERAFNALQYSDDSALGGVFASENFTFSNAPVYLFMLSLEAVKDANLGDEVWLNFKSSDVSLATNRLKNYSVQNELVCQITQILKGEIVSLVQLKFGEYELESIISTASCQRLNLCIGMNVFAYIKSTSLHIGRIK